MKFDRTLRNIPYAASFSALLPKVRFYHLYYKLFQWNFQGQ